jgi:hypothetical protein
MITMRRFPRPRFAAWATAIAVLSFVLTVALPADEGEGEGGVESKAISLGSSTALLAPVGRTLSGRTWLLTEGLDPGLRRRPGSDPLTRLNWRELEQSFGAGASPTLQAAGGGFLVPYRSAAPAFSRDILISRDFSSIPIQTEPNIVLSPDDPNYAVVGMIDYNFPSLSTYVTIDGGVTWEGPFQGGYLPDDLISGGDPVLALDRAKNLYLASISIGEEEFNIGPVYTSSMVSSIAISRSKDGGRSWPLIVSTARSGVKISDQQIDPQGRLRGNVSIGFLDKPWLAVGSQPQDPTKDVLYVTYVDFEIFYEIIYLGELPMLLPREQASTIRLVRSEDQGVTWSDPVAVSATVRKVFGEVEGGGSLPGVSGTDRLVQGPRPVVGRDGTVYVAWMDSTDDGSMKGLGELRTASSTDMGKTFAAPVTAAVFNEIPFRPRNGFFRYWGAAFPRIAVGPNDELYLVYTARPPEKPRDDGDIFFTLSTDRGKTWSNPVRLNGDEGMALQFFPEITVGPDGTLHAMWGDMRDDPAQARYQIYYTRSRDGGKTWGFELPELGVKEPDTRVSDFPSNANRGFSYGLFIGDYFSIAANSQDVFMVWADTRLGEFGGINQKIAFARQKAIRAPDLFISPSAGPGGQSITLQGFNFQPEMNVMVQMGDAVIASSRTNKEGRFTAAIYIPVTGEGAQNVRVYDESGNLAESSFYTEFGFGNIQQVYEDLLSEMQKLGGQLRGAP